MQRYYDKITLTLGEAFPVVNPRPGREGFMGMTYARGLHLVLYSEMVEYDARSFAGAELVLGMVEQEATALLVLAFAGTQTAGVFGLNGFAIIPDERRRWCRETHGDVLVSLVDAETGVLRAVRQWNSVWWLRQVQEAVARQLARYTDIDAAQAVAERLMDTLPAEEIMHQAMATGRVVCQAPPHGGALGVNSGMRDN